MSPLPEAEQLDKIEGPSSENGARPSKVTQLYSIEDLSKLPPPSYLLKPFIRTRGTNVIFGDPGSGKSLTALDWFMRIASGTPFFSGAKPTQGLVVFIAAEGVYGLLPRFDAWCEANGIEWPEDFKAWPEAVNFRTGDTAALETAIAALPKPPVAICVDTLARCMAGGDENSVQDMGKFIEQAERVANHFDAALLIVHHKGKDGKSERGSTALRAASDLMVDVKKDGATLKLTSSKDKDAPPFDLWNLHLEPYGESVAIRPGAASGQLKESERTVLDAVQRSFRTEWVSMTKAKGVANQPDSTFYEAVNGLVQAGYLEERRCGKQGKEVRVTPESPPPSGTVRNCPDGQTKNRPATGGSLDPPDGQLDGPGGMKEGKA